MNWFVKNYLKYFRKLPKLTFREGTNDEGLFVDVFKNNEYKFPESALGWTVLDLGAHIGTFSLLAYSRGAKKIIAVESDTENFEILKTNTKGLKNIKLYNNAISSSDGEKFNCYKYVHIFSWGSCNYINTGGRGIIKGLNEDLLNDHEKREYKILPNTVDSISIKALLKTNNLRDIDFMKIDVEGTEKEIFKNIDIQDLLKLKRIAGEYHQTEKREGEQLLKEKLEPYYHLEIAPNPATYELGLFFAKLK